MPFSVKAYYADRPLTVIAETAKEAFAKAIEWHVVERFTNVSISDGIKSYSIDRFASAGSTGRRNTGVKSLCWCFKLQGLTWSFV